MDRVVVNEIVVDVDAVTDTDAVVVAVGDGDGGATGSISHMYPAVLVSGYVDRPWNFDNVEILITTSRFVVLMTTPDTHRHNDTPLLHHNHARLQLPVDVLTSTSSVLHNNITNNVTHPGSLDSHKPQPFAVGKLPQFNNVASDESTYANGDVPVDRLAPIQATVRPDAAHTTQSIQRHPHHRLNRSHQQHH